MRHSFNHFLGSWSGRSILLILVAYLSISVQYRWIGDNGKAWKDVYRSDVKGYYGYLLSTLIRHDLGNEEFDTEHMYITPTGSLNKYFVGTSLMMAPWFAVGHLIATATQQPTSGLSAPYLIMVSFGAVMYAIIGLLAMRALMRRMEFDDVRIAILLLSLGFGTLLLQYTTIQPGWTHVHTFSLVACSMLVLWLANETGKRKWTILAGVLFGLIILIRPVNGLVVLGIPILFGKATWAFITNLFKDRIAVLLSFLAVVLMISIQSILWHAQTGNWIEWSYRGEGFHWSEPAFIEVMFSFRRGLFIYTPILLFFLVGIGVLWKCDRTRAVWTLVYFCLVTYVISAWWIWDYGGGFGQRPYIDHYPVLILVMGLALEHMSSAMRKITYSFFGACIVLFLLQWWQFQREIIQHEYMDAQKYAHVFMRFGQEYEFCLGGAAQFPPYHPNGMEVVFEEANTLIAIGSAWSGGKIIDGVDIAGSSPPVNMLSGGAAFSTTLRLRNDLIPEGRALFLEVWMERYEPVAAASDGALAVVAIEDDAGEKRHYDVERLNPIKGTADASWQAIHLTFQLPEMQQGDELAFYIWNKDGGTFFLDDLRAKVHAVKPY